MTAGENTQHEGTPWPKFWWGASLVLVFNILNYHLGYDLSTIEIELFTGTFLNDLGSGLLAWLLCFFSIIGIQSKLDPQLPYWQKLLVQVGATIIIAVTVIITWTEMTSATVNKQLVDPSFYFQLMPVIVLEIIIFNLLFPPTRRQGESSFRGQNLGTFRLRKQKKEVIVPGHELAVFEIEKGLVWAFTFEGDRYYTDQTIKDLESRLPSFFRINRQYLVHHKAILTLETIENNKVSVEIRIGSSCRKVVVSRERAPSFRKWIKVSHGSTLI